MKILYRKILSPILLFGAIGMINGSIVSAQYDHANFYEGSLSVNKTGMYTLGGWAVTNLTTGAIGWMNNEGPNKYFHQMNFLWNTVNISLAGFGLYNISREPPQELGHEEILKRHIRYEKLFLINGGLDLAYIGTGFILKNISNQHAERSDILEGYGNSLILQGGFLLVFDAVLYGIQKTRRNEFQDNLQLGYSNGGLVLRYRF